MLSLTPIVTLLTPKPADFAGHWFRKVSGAAEFAKSHQGLPLPQCWVIRAAEKTNHIGFGGEDLQIAFDVVIAIENVRTQQVSERDDALLLYRQAVKTLLLGHDFNGALKPIQYDGGQVLDYTDGDIYWRDRYLINAMIENYP